MYKRLYAKYVDAEISRQQEVPEDVQREHARQKEFLEKTVETLKRKLAKEAEGHRDENARIMQENMDLIKEINELRREMKALKSMEQWRKATQRPSSSPGVGEELDQKDKEIEMQKQEISRLRARIEELEAAMGKKPPSRPISREKLPPMEGFTEAVET